MSAHSEVVKKSKRRLKNRLLNIFGMRCSRCFSTKNLQFAHKKPDEMNGEGRGSYKRYVWIKNHMDNFFLACKTCHDRYDGKLYIH